VSCDHLLNGNNSERRANAEACGGQSSGEAPAVGKPLECVANAGAVDSARAETPDDLSDVQHRERVCEGIEDPSEPGEEATREHHDPRPEAIDEVALGGHQPRFKQHEQRERHLDRRQAPTEFFADGNCEKCPAILEIGNHHHADDADDQLGPTGRIGNPRGRSIGL